MSMVCPICEMEYEERPAISRTDSTTLICPDCGIRQSLESIGVPEYDWDKIIEIIHGWERRKKFHVI